MNKSISNEGCHCRNKSKPSIFNMQTKYQSEKLCDFKFKNAKTQTEADPDLKAQEQIAELLTEIAVTLNQKTKLENELCSIQSKANKIEEAYHKEKNAAEAEIARLTDANLEKESLLSKLKIKHLEEQKILLSQINELNAELNILREDKEQSHQSSATTALLEHKLNTALMDLKNEQDKNETYISKINKYKNKIRYLTKYIKQLVEEVNTTKIKKGDHGDILEYKRSLSIGCRQKSSSHHNITSTQSILKKPEPDIENMILSELFFKPNPVPNDVVSLFFCSTDSQQ